MFDIVIIGGNISGSCAAINAAKNGIDVVLIERNKEMFNPPHCGEGIADITYDYLKFGEVGCKKNQINNFTINVSDIKEYKLKLKKHYIYIFDRNFAEKELLKRAEKNGVELILGKRMKNFNPPDEVILDRKKIKGKVIIDASGISCRVGQKIGLCTKLKPEDVGVCIQSRVESNFPSDKVQLWYHKPYAPFGYAWVFPKDNNTANIGFGIPGGLKLDLEELLNKYIKFVTNNDYKILHTFRSCVPSAHPLKKLVKNNVMIVGDAARLSNPATGAGIHNAIFSGSLAGLIASKYVRGEIPSLDEYQVIMQKKVTRLIKDYHNKTMLKTDEDFIKGYKKAFSILSILNKISPGIFQNYVAKMLKRDFDILDKYKR
ncbi:hypothetical protein AYK20_00815 [Thermoplasmatales archaeon SG8-52-1]|nr:MAG: hypothetical protein AYK20_00815 [Thermoplasmatales archaeon SG8-52-1]